MLDGAVSSLSTTLNEEKKTASKKFGATSAIDIQFINHVKVALKVNMSIHRSKKRKIMKIH